MESFLVTFFLKKCIHLLPKGTVGKLESGWKFKKKTEELWK